MVECRTLLFGLLGPIGCAATPATPPPGPAIEYRLSVADDYQVAQVHACFRGFTPARLVPGGQVAHRMLENPVALETGVPLEHHREVEHRQWRGRTFEQIDGYLDLENAGECVRYDLAYGDLLRQRVGGAKPWVSMMSRLWMWQPVPPPTDPVITVRVDAPKGANVVMPWTRRSDGTYAPPPSTFRYVSHTSIGEFPVQVLDVPGGELRVANLAGLDEDAVAGWLGGAAAAVAGIYGEFPAPGLRVHLVGAGTWDGGAVGFGQVQRGGDLAVVLYMNEGAEPSDLVRDWQAIHEFSHTGLPYITDSWCAEGFATYLTSVAMTRSGRRSERAGWQHLAEFLVHGQAWNPDPYWRGATLAFLMDVEIRKRTRGRKSFDDAIRHLRDCCGGAAQRRSAAEVMRELDRWSGSTYLSELVARHKKSPVPAVEETLDALGVTLDDYTITYDVEAPLSELRASLLTPELDE